MLPTMMSTSSLSLFDFRIAKPSKVWKSGETKQKMKNSGEILKIIHEITYYFYEEIRGKENKIWGKNRKINHQNVEMSQKKVGNPD